MLEAGIWCNMDDREIMLELKYDCTGPVLDVVDGWIIHHCDECVLFPGCPIYNFKRDLGFAVELAPDDRRKGR